MKTQESLSSEGGRALRAELWETPEFKRQVEKREAGARTRKGMTWMPS